MSLHGHLNMLQGFPSLVPLQLWSLCPKGPLPSYLSSPILPVLSACPTHEEASSSFL